MIIDQHTRLIPRKFPHTHVSVEIVLIDHKASRNKRKSENGERNEDKVRKLRNEYGDSHYQE